MSIEVLQTMKWSQLCWDQSFEKVIHMEDILPKKGETYPVNLTENENYAQEGDICILWQPPHSELNGWNNKRPAEIINSYVLKGKLRHSDVQGVQFKFEVDDQIRLIDLFDQVSETAQSPLSYIGQSSGRSKLQWNDAYGVLKYRFGKFIYLSGSECESSLEVIISYDSERLCLHYSATLHHPASYETVVTKYYPNPKEVIALEKFLDEAEDIEDSSAESLEEGQIFGAEYW